MIVYGKNVAKEVIQSGKQINKVFLTNSFSDRGILDYLEKNNIKRIIIDKREMDNKYKGNHQGIVLDIEDFKYSNLSDILDKDFIVILDHLEDPHNFGAIIRTCEASGVDAIVIPKNRSVSVNSTVMKVSAGAINNVTIVEVNNLVSAINELKDNGFWVYGTDMEDSEVYTDVNYDSKVALVIGNEGDGISRLVRENCDFVINIPMTGKINSLNASVAAGIVIYEVVRQKNRR
jgi:23S rRNA (guanosine2251-2'-O)-methyltransferase